MSYLEFVGTLLNLASVWLVTRKSVWNWPIGNVAVILFGLLFYQIQLYSDLVEQLYFLITGFYGWWVWVSRAKGSEVEASETEGITSLTSRAKRIVIGLTIGGTAAMGWLMSRIHMIWPRFFQEPASFPYLDAWTTVMSFIAQALMTHKKIDCWVLWIAVDIIGIGLYWARGVLFVSLLYGVFLLLATRGLIVWHKTLQRSPAQ